MSGSSRYWPEPTRVEALSAIALANGFADQSHFSRTFKRFMNMTPDAYRKAHANTTNA